MKRIIFWCPGGGGEEWAPPVLNTTGIGGSETAVVKIAEQFAGAGWTTDVYCHAGRYEGEYDGVGYWEPERLEGGTNADVLVVWRNPAAHSIPITATQRVLWCHDVAYGPGVAGDMRVWDRVLGVSAHHANHLGRVYGLQADKMDFVPNGIDPARFVDTGRKIPGRCVYASSPDRGLDILLDLWPKIIGDETFPELHIAYGWENFDIGIRHGRRDLAALKERIEKQISNTPQVVWRGRLPQNELAQLYGESVAWLYPTAFFETSCISAAEAMAGGCVPVCSAVGALRETVGDGGVVVTGPNGTRSNPYSSAWRDFWVQCVQGVVFETNLRLTLAAQARQRAQSLTWEHAFARWLQILE